MLKRRSFLLRIVMAGTLSTAALATGSWSAADTPAALMPPPGWAYPTNPPVAPGEYWCLGADRDRAMEANRLRAARQPRVRQGCGQAPPIPGPSRIAATRTSLAAQLIRQLR